MPQSANRRRTSDDEWLSFSDTDDCVSPFEDGLAHMQCPEFVLRLPDWVGEFLPGPDEVYPSVEDRMHLIIELSQLNVVHGGGPFGAGVFNQETQQLVAPGVNLVVPAQCSVLHAEVVALILAQHTVGHYDLSSEGGHSYELVASTEPCAMCLGAICWSGIRSLACGAREEDARRIGFDEGPKLPQWPQALTSRGIAVVRDVCRDRSTAVLQHYRASGGLIYNARRGRT